MWLQIGQKSDAVIAEENCGPVHLQRCKNTWKFSIKHSLCNAKWLDSFLEIAHTLAL